MSTAIRPYPGASPDGVARAQRCGKQIFTVFHSTPPRVCSTSCSRVFQRIQAKSRLHPARADVHSHKIKVILRSCDVAPTVTFTAVVDGDERGRGSPSVSVLRGPTRSSITHAQLLRASYPPEFACNQLIDNYNPFTRSLPRAGLTTGAEWRRLQHHRALFSQPPKARDHSLTITMLRRGFVSPTRVTLQPFNPAILERPADVLGPGVNAAFADGNQSYSSSSPVQSSDLGLRRIEGGPMCPRHHLDNTSGLVVRQLVAW